MVHIFNSKWFLISLSIVMAGLFLWVTEISKRLNFDAMAAGAGVGAKLACSGVYLMGRDPEEVVQRDLRPFMNPLLRSTQFEFDFQNKTASATMAGLVTRTAFYREGVGCTLMIDTDREHLIKQAVAIKYFKRNHRPQEWPEGDMVTITRTQNESATGPMAEIDWQKLGQAIDGAFEDNTEYKTIDTRAIIVVYDGKIIAEKYADGFSNQSRFLSWSASKSIVNALIGTMVTDGKLGLYDPAPVPEWASADDIRHNIRLHHLLTMSSGLEFVEERYVPGEDSVVMLFETARMAEYAAIKSLAKAPGSSWSYSSGTTNLLSRILYDMAGASLKSVHDYSWKRFFLPVGMTSAIFEPDVTGAHVGSSYFYATAQDWARFGLLFLNMGRVGDKQILSEDWVNYSKTPTPLSYQGQYGAQFWLNGGHPDREEGHMMPDCPEDMYMASGFNGQYTVIVPSKKAVLVRLGWTNGTRFDTNKHFSAILDALPNNAATNGTLRTNLD